MLKKILKKIKVIVKIIIKAPYSTTIIFSNFISSFLSVIGILGELYRADERVMFLGFVLIFLMYIFSCKLALRYLSNAKA